MKRSKIASAIAVMTLLQSVAHAQVDLPDPTADGGGGSTPTTNQPAQTSLTAAHATITNISRKPGGALYTLKLMQPMGLARIDLRVSVAQAKIYKTTVVTDNGQRIEIRNLSNTGQLSTGAALESETINSSMKAVSIELQIESFGAEASVVLTALAPSGYPAMSLTTQSSSTDVGVTPAPNTTTDGKVTKPEDVRPTLPTNPTYPTNPTTPTTPTTPTNPGPFVPPVDIGAVGSNTFTAGELALLNGFQIVRVTGGYGDQVEYTVDGRSRIWVSKSALQKSSRCYGSICQGDSVSYANQYGQLQTGTVESAFANGKLVVGMSGASYVIDANMVNKAGGVNNGGIGGNNGGYQPNPNAGLDCTISQKFCLNDLVLYQNQYVGRITSVLDGGDVIEVSLNGFDRTFTVYTDQLISAVGCSAGVCPGSRTTYQGISVTVTGIFANGLSGIRLDGQMTDSIVPTSQLGQGGNRPGQYQGAQFRVGQQVKYQNRTVTIKEIYSNGQIRISSGTLFGNDMIVDASMIRR